MMDNITEGSQNQIANHIEKQIKAFGFGYIRSSNQNNHNETNRYDDQIPYRRIIIKIQLLPHRISSISYLNAGTKMTPLLVNCTKKN